MRTDKVVRSGAVAVVVVLCGAAMAADTAPASAPEIVDRGAATPKAALEAMAALLSTKAPTADWMGLQPPANRELAKEQLKLAADLGAKAKSVADLVESKIGKTQADMVRSMQTGVTAGWELELKGQLQGIVRDGKLNGDKVKINENGDKADIAIIDSNDTIPLTKVNGKWYLGENGKHATLPKDIEGNRKATAHSMKLLDQVEQKVKAGQLTKSNFMTEYIKLVNETMSGAG